MQALADATIERFGAVHVLCNNAGVETGADFAAIPAQAWEWVLGVNLWGVLHGCRIFLPLIREQGEGHIVNTASLAAFATGLPTFAPYTTSKFAILAASECLELELLAAGDPIGVSLLCPGVVNTRMPDAERNRPAGVPSTDGNPQRDAILGELRRLAAEVGMDPAEVAGMVVDAIRERRFFVLTHPDDAIGAVERRLAWMRTGVAPGLRAPGSTQPRPQEVGDERPADHDPATAPEPELTPAQMIARAIALRDDARRRAGGDRAARRYYSEEMHRAFLDAGFYHLYVPRRYGGYEFDVPTYMRVVQEIARGCVSTGWCLGLTMNHALRSARGGRRRRRTRSSPAATSARARSRRRSAPRRATTGAGRSTARSRSRRARRTRPTTWARRCSRRRARRGRRRCCCSSRRAASGRCSTTGATCSA